MEAETEWILSTPIRPHSRLAPQQVPILTVLSSATTRGMFRGMSQDGNWMEMARDFVEWTCSLEINGANTTFTNGWAKYINGNKMKEEHYTIICNGLYECAMYKTVKKQSSGRGGREYVLAPDKYVCKNCQNGSNVNLVRGRHL